MEKTVMLKEEAHAISHSSSGRRSSASNSPDFQFWMVRNPSCPQPNLCSADELFVNGVLLPLDRLPQNYSDPPGFELQIPTSEQESSIRCFEKSEPGPLPELSALTHESSTVLTVSKRWKDILFNSKGGQDKKPQTEKDKVKKMERKSRGRTSSAELNINLWPFTRSRSAGNNGVKSKNVYGIPAARKVSSAPCSRSNSSGDSKNRKWPASPNRAGVHLGRSSPVWQVRRGSSNLKISDPPVQNSEKGIKKDVPETRRSKVPVFSSTASGGGPKALVLNVDVPICNGYRNPMSCKSGENKTVGEVGGDCGVAHGGHGGNLFNFRNLFTKKVH